MSVGWRKVLSECCHCCAEECQLGIGGYWVSKHVLTETA